MMSSRVCACVCTIFERLVKVWLVGGLKLPQLKTCGKGLDQMTVTAHHPPFLPPPPPWNWLSWPHLFFIFFCLTCHRRLSSTGCQCRVCVCVFDVENHWSAHRQRVGSSCSQFSIGFTTHTDRPTDKRTNGQNCQERPI